MVKIVSIKVKKGAISQIERNPTKKRKKQRKQAAIIAEKVKKVNPRKDKSVHIHILPTINLTVQPTTKIQTNMPRNHTKYDLGIAYPF